MTIDSFVLSSRNFVDHFATGTHNTLAGKEYLDNLIKHVDQLSKLQWTILDSGIAQIGETPEASLPVMTLMAAKSISSEFSIVGNLDIFLVQLRTYLDTVNFAQLRLCPTIVVTIFQRLSDILAIRQSSVKIIQPLCTAIKGIQSSPKQVTSLHAILAQNCLDSLTLKIALPFLIDDIDEFSSELKGGDGKSILLYFYYGGMIFAGLKKYKEALFYFEACLRVPSVTLSHIMLEAYKKFVLLSLYYYGEVHEPPKCAVQAVNRILKPAATPYNEIVSVFLTHNPIELNNVINRHAEVIRRDKNFGLVKQVKTALTKLNIQRLTKTFLTLSLVDVAARVQLPGGAKQAEELILFMIQDGEIYAKINQRDGMVIFLDNKEKYNSSLVMSKIEKKVAVCIELNKRLHDLNEKLATNPDYVSKISMSNEDEGISSSSKMSGLTGFSYEQI